ncbi:MAG: hypothetical protein MI924_28195 [Chloroflexales bacterium]|nr:hypothetical protein [Chloroflexales bacterium]
MTTDVQNLTVWQRLWFICAGATSVLVATAVNEFPSLSTYQVTLIGWFFNPVYSGWIWALLALEITCIGAGITLLVRSNHRQIPIRSRINQAFGFLALAWIAGVVFFIRLSGEIPLLLLWFATMTLIVLGTLYWLWRRRIEVKEELFP